MNEHLQLTDYYIDKYLNNNINKTIRECLNIIEEHQADYLTYFKLGFAYFMQGKQDVAIKYFDKSIDLKNDFIHSYYFRGYAFLKIDINDSIENFLKALDLSPNEPLVLFYLGVAYEHKDIQKAIEYYTKCINTNFEMVIDAYYWRAKCYFEIKDYKSAIQDLNYVINLNPKYDDALILRGNSYIYGDIDINKGLNDYELVVNLNIEEYILKALHEILSFSNDFKRTLEYCNIAIEKNKTTNMEIYAFRSAMYNALQEYDKALQDADKALENDSNDVYYLMNKAESLVGLKEYDNAIELLSKAIKIEPKHCGVLQVLSMAYINKKDFEKALKCMDKSLNICDCCAEHYIIRGYIEMQMEKFEDAIKDFEVVINSEFQTNPSAQEQLSAFINHSISNFKLNNNDNAIFDIEKSIELINDSTLKEDLEKLKENLSNKSANTEELYEKIVENYFSL